MNSWGIYVVSAVALVLVLTPQLSGLVRYARESADLRYMDGVQAAVDALQPGVIVRIGPAPSFAPDPIIFGGRSLSSNCGSSTLVVSTDYPLSNATLSPASDYVLSLLNGVVVVTQVG
jgi:hypothetical protein